ncbi:hypothetical protein Drorol1_Dr00006897 [Drosera rotundifolia]
MKSIWTHHFDEDVPGTKAVKVSGTKPPLSGAPVNPLKSSSPSSTNTSGYVFRKLAMEAREGNINEIVSHKADDHQLRHLGSQVDIIPRKVQMVAPGKQCLTLFSPTPTASVIPSSAPTLGSSKNISTAPSSDQKIMTKQYWDERYHQLQLRLRELDKLNEEHYLQPLRSLSSDELNRHAVELENRAICLALEEGKEIKRTIAMNVLRKSLKNSKLQQFRKNSPYANRTG